MNYPMFPIKIQFHMRIESSIEDVGILDSACLPGSSCNESEMSIPAVGNVEFLCISGEEIAPVDTSNSHSTTVIGEDLNSVLSICSIRLCKMQGIGYKNVVQPPMF